MKIRVRFVSGRSIEGIVAPGDVGPMAAMFAYLDPTPQPIPTPSGLREVEGWIRLIDADAAAHPHGVNLAHVETITEIAE